MLPICQLLDHFMQLNLPANIGAAFACHPDQLTTSARCVKHLALLEHQILIVVLCTIKNLTLVNIAMFIKKYCFYVQILDRERQVFALPDKVDLVLFIFYPCLCLIESFDYCEFFGDVKIELHAEVIDEIELKADQTFNIVFFKLAGCYTSLIEAEDMFDFLILEDLSDFQ